MLCFFLLGCTDGNVKLLQRVQRDKRLSGILTFLSNPPLPEDYKELLGVSREGEVAYQKMIMVQSTIFIGTNTSTFSDDIEMMRLALGFASCEDRYLYRL